MERKTTTTTTRGRPRRRQSRRRKTTTRITTVAPRRKPAVRLPQMNVQISGCARDYMRALTNPFKIISPLPCIPDVITIASGKYRYVKRTNFNVGSAGLGFIAVNSQLSMFNNVTSVWKTQSSYVGSAGAIIDLATAGGTGVTPESTSANFQTVANSFISGESRIRLVGCGVRVRYTGTTLDMAGTCIIYRAPGNFESIYIVGNLLLQPSTGFGITSRGWESVCYVPYNPDQLGYRTATEIVATSGGGTLLIPDAAADLVIAITGGIPGSSFSAEVVNYIEAIGPAAMQLSKSHSDPTGMGSAISAIPGIVEANKSPDTIEKETYGRMLQEFVHNVSGVLPSMSTVGQAAVAGVQLYMRGRSGYGRNTMPMIMDVD